MSNHRKPAPAGQQLAIENPDVRAWLAEFGRIEHAISIRLLCSNSRDLEIQIARLESAFGKAIAMTRPRRSEGDSAWVAYGTMTE